MSNTKNILLTGGSGFIGTALVDHFLESGVPVTNLDIKCPNKKTHREYWRQCNILDFDQVKKVFHDVAPTHVIHLAARTDTFGTTLDDYRINTEGTWKILEATKSTPSISLIIVTSTQFVKRPGKLPKHDKDFDPQTVYGQSKVIAEQLTRSANLKCTWTIVRPTNIWGPWHPRYPKEFFRILKNGLYLHPGKKPVIRSYGYIGNVVYQIDKILDALPMVVDRKVYYLGDKPIDIFEWVNGFSEALVGREVRVIPRSIVRTIAVIGDIIRFFGIRFPIFSSRFRSMTEDYPTPMETTFDAFGKPPYSLREGIEETVEWLNRQGTISHQSKG